MLKNVSQLTIIVNGKSYQYSCDIDATMPDIKESLFQFQKYIGQIEDNMKAQQEAKKAQEETEKEKVTSIAEVKSETQG